MTGLIYATTPTEIPEKVSAAAEALTGPTADPNRWVQLQRIFGNSLRTPDCHGFCNTTRG
jgi:hypothetical protein